MEQYGCADSRPPASAAAAHVILGLVRLVPRIQRAVDSAPNCVTAIGAAANNFLFETSRTKVERAAGGLLRSLTHPTAECVLHLAGDAIDDGQKHASGTMRNAFALFPIAHRRER